MKEGKLYIHVEQVRNGFILKDLTRSKTKEDGEEPKTVIAKDFEELKDEINTLMGEHLTKPGTRAIPVRPELNGSDFPPSFEKKY